MTLKVCLALPVFYPTFGGGPLRFLRYQPGLRKRDIQARVLAGTARAKDDSHGNGGDPKWDAYPIGSMLPVEDIDGIPVHRVRLPQQTSVRRTSIYFQALIALCREPSTRPDVIQLHSFERLEALFWLWRLRRLSIPLVYAIQIARPVRHRIAILRWAKRLMIRVFYNRFDGIVTSSEAIRAYLIGLGVQAPIVVIPNGVDLDHYRPGDDEERANTRASLGIQGSGPVVLSVGAISPRKGSDLLVEAWTKLLEDEPDAELVFVGPRHDRKSGGLDQFDTRVRELVAASPHPERIHFTGVRDDLPALYAAADLVVLPTSREGGTPNVVLEAMACERPVLITSFEGQSKAIGRPGFEFEQAERSPVALARAMAEILANSSRRDHLVRHGKDWVVSHLALSTSLDGFAEFYRQAARDALDSTLVHDSDLMKDKEEELGLAKTHAIAATSAESS
jgi:glycosyltransferase involved in cell wall biosynthesis